MCGAPRGEVHWGGESDRLLLTYVQAESKREGEAWEEESRGERSKGDKKRKAQMRGGKNNGWRGENPGVRQTLGKSHLKALGRKGAKGI